MRKNFPIIVSFLTILLLFPAVSTLSAQEDAKLNIDPTETRQTVTGFGAALAYYEGWLNAHPKKSEIYELIFGELSLDILRVRNAYGYDPEMVGRVKEYMIVAEASLGHPIQLLSSSWAPVDSLKNTGDRKNGGTIRYTSGPGGVEFDYAGFASWWKGSLDEYAASGIMPDYISIQNEPGWSASYESCRFNPRETINSTDTIAGYDKALNAVYDTLATLSDRPKILGPEVLGIGYNKVESYTNALDLSKLDGLAHHLYHGVDEDDPYASDVFSKIGDFHPELPHFQTEFSRGDWFSLAGLIYKSFHDEEVTAYLYWDLTWGDTGGLVTTEFPWDSNRWTDPAKGYIVNMEYYAFKQFSAFIHPGWKRINTEVPGEELKQLTFVSPGLDSMTCVVINRSETDTHSLNINIEGYRIRESAIFTTSQTEKCSPMGSLADSLLIIAPHSITTLSMQLEAYNPEDDHEAPSVPKNLSASDLSHDSFMLSWDASSDNVGVKSYSIFLNGDSIGSSSATGYLLSSLEMGTTYTLSISARDDAGNESALSAELIMTTLMLDLDPPILECSDSIYQEGILEVNSSEVGMIYLVPEGTEEDMITIRSNAIDSILVEGGVSINMPISGFENGAYWLYARDSINNLSEPAVFTVYGVGVDLSVVQQISLYPNPMLEIATLELSLKEPASLWIILYDSRGREVRREFSGSFQGGAQTITLHRNELEGGFYLLKVMGDSGMLYSGKLLIGK